MLGTDTRSKYFWKRIWMFHSGMTMPSFQVPHDATVYKEQNSAIQILGQVHHRIGAMRNQYENPKCLQTYFYDVEMQAEIYVGLLRGRS